VGGEHFKRAAGKIDRVAVALLLALPVFFLACNRSKPFPAAEPLEWMNQTYNPHDDGPNFGKGRGHWVESYPDRQQNGSEIIKKRREVAEWFSYAGCRITLHFQNDPGDMRYKYVATFQLSDIDPASIKLVSGDSQWYGESCNNPSVAFRGKSCDEGWITFATRNEAPLIEEDVENLDLNESGQPIFPEHKTKEYKAEFVATDLEYAERFEKAFRNAVELCGGKPSAF
jgi:hypothetical protein